MYRKIFYIPQPCTGKIKEREREIQRGGGEERGGSEGGRGGREVGREGGERERKLILFFPANEWQTSTKTPAPLIFL